MGCKGIVILEVTSVNLRIAMILMEKVKLRGLYVFRLSWTTICIKEKNTFWIVIRNILCLIFAILNLVDL